MTVDDDDLPYGCATAMQISGAILIAIAAFAIWSLVQ